MVRKGTLAFLVIGLAACTQDVDDPANFTAGNSQGNTSGNGSSSGGGAADTDSATGVAEGGIGATDSTSSSSGGPADSTSNATTIGPADSGGGGNCGNGVIDAGEQCDGAELQGFDCASLGLSGGTLACDAMMCTFDTSMCMSTTGGTSG